MRILAFHVKGFRSLRDVRWTPGDLNVLIGSNASGKSNLLRLLELAATSAQGRLGKYIQRAGGMAPLLWDGTDEKISLRCVWLPREIRQDLAEEYLLYELVLLRLGQSSVHWIDREWLGNYSKSRQALTMSLQRLGPCAYVFDEHEQRLAVPEDEVPEEETLLSLAAGLSYANRQAIMFHHHLSSWCVYHDLNVSQDAPIRQAVIARVEKRVAPDGQNLASVLHTLYTGDRQFKKDINAAMRAALGDDFEELVFPPAADQQIQLCVRWKSLKREQSAADLSDGTLRFLFLLTVLASPFPAPLIAIDDPETGLHPSMLPIVAEYAVEASRRAQVILSTHSSQLLDAFGDTHPTTTVVKWHDGETHLHKLEGAKLDDWLKEYTLGALFRSGELEEV
jgi:predicted ATPase